MTTNRLETDTDQPAARRSSTRRWLVGWALCVLPAAALAACSIAADDDVESQEAAATPTATDSPPDTAAETTSSSSDPVVSTEPESLPDPESISTSIDDDPAVSPISFAGDIEPIITSTCANCHTGSGPGTQHVRMDTAGIVAKASLGIEFVTRTGFMPPWPAGGESIDYERDWSLTDEEIALLAEWHEAGSPLDVPVDHVIAPVPGDTFRLDDPDLEVLSQGSYDGELGQPDEYRCLVYDPELTEPGFLTGMDFLPQQEQVVHHAVGFLLSGADRAAIEEIDGVDGNGGWTCFGFSPGPTAELVYAWAPGQAATRYPDGSGLAVGPDDFFVIQTHYHFDVEAPADQSTLALDWVGGDEAADIDPVDITVYLGPAEIPCRSDEVGPLCDRDAAVALAIEKYGSGGLFADGILRLCGQTPEDYAGFTDGIATSTCDQRANARGELISVFGHEHEVGASFKMTLNPDTPDEVVLLDIPDWDFDWQLNYEPVDSIVIEPGDIVRMECTWDRARRDPALEPAYIVWSDGTDDEMCFASIVTRPV